MHPIGQRYLRATHATWSKLYLASLLVTTMAAAGCKGQRQPIASAAIPQEYLTRFAPLPREFASPANPITPEKVALGRMLFNDTRFSADRDISCYVCHPLHEYGTTHRVKAVGHLHQEGPLNEPTVYNAAGQFAQFWDGRVPDVEAQALGPLLNPLEMALPDSLKVVAIIREIPGYIPAFQAAFPGEADPVTFTNFGKAVGAFERGLVTPAPWDRFLQGDTSALSAEEKAGFNTFATVGCIQCHNGPLVGGNSFEKLGLVKPWPDSTDLGRYDVTHRPEDKLVFKVPMLRNITETWPYFHDGSVERLEEAVRLMGEYQLGIQLTDAQIASIVTWLRTLKGELPASYIERPNLPTGGQDTLPPAPAPPGQ
jgi:cytochrome c peroxidase